jgi:hypothetical protein
VLLDGHLAGRKHSAAEVVAKVQAVRSELEPLQAMFDVGYLPPNTSGCCKIRHRREPFSIFHLIHHLLTRYQMHQKNYA